MSGESSLLIAYAVDAASWLCLLGGAAFCLVGGIGILRMPDFYTRGHAAGVSDTLGAGLILLGLMFQAGFSLVAVKLVMVFFFLYVTSPTSTHALFKSAYAGGVRWDLVREQHHPKANSFDNATQGGDDDFD